MKTILIVLTCSLAVLSACVGVAVFQARQEVQASKRAAAKLDEQVQELSAQLTALTAEKVRLEENLQTETDAVKILQAQLDKERVEVEPAPAPIQPPKPFRVQTYLGREPLGEAWLIPRNFAQDPETGRASYEPVIMLDEKLKQKFTVVVHETNYVEQPVSTTVNYNYTPPRTYYYPVYYGVPVRRPNRPHPPDQPSRPTQPPIMRAVGTGSGSPWGSVFVPPRTGSGTFQR